MCIIYLCYEDNSIMHFTNIYKMKDTILQVHQMSMVYMSTSALALHTS